MTTTSSNGSTTLSPNQTKKQRKKLAKREAKTMLKRDRARDAVQKAEQRLAKAQARLEARITRLRNLEARLAEMHAPEQESEMHAQEGGVDGQEGQSEISSTAHHATDLSDQYESNPSVPHLNLDQPLSDSAESTDETAEEQGIFQFGVEDYPDAFRSSADPSTASSDTSPASETESSDLPVEGRADIAEDTHQEQELAEQRKQDTEATEE